MNDDINKDLGIVTAYAYAVSKGYTGTEDEFAALMADYADVGERAEAAATAAAASATAASGSASDSAASATAAAGSAGTATTAAGNASQASTTATTKASEAAQSATQAVGSATTASTKASEAAQSALQAAGSATAAESAKTAAQTAQGAAETAQTAAETAQGAAEDAAESVSASAAQIAQNTADISSVKNALGACIITDTASGAIATFTDGSDGVPMRSVTVDMEPIQDLHGQASPYPAGGSKNLIPLTLDGIKAKNTRGTWSGNSYANYGVTFTILTDNDGNVIGINANGTASQNASLSLPLPSIADGTSVVLNGCPQQASIITRIWVGESGYSDIVADSGHGVTFTYSEDVARIWCQVLTGKTANNMVFKPMIRLASVTDGTFAPYSNICPISGRSEVGVWRSGVNVWDEEWEVGNINSSGANEPASDRIRTKNFISVVGGETYYLNLPKAAVFHMWDAEQNYIGNLYKASAATWTLPANVAYLKFRMDASYGTTYNHDISINYPSTDHDYHASDIASITVQLGQTVYGGSDEVVSGTLTNNRASITLTNASQLSGFIQSAQGAYAIIASNGKVANASVEVICDRAVGVSFNNRTAVDYVNKLRCYVDSNGAVTIRANADSQASSASELFALFENAQIVYELATPVSVQLTAQQLTTLLGTNNMWSDGGDVSVEYVADAKAYIAKVIAAALA